MDAVAQRQAAGLALAAVEAGKWLHWASLVAWAPARTASPWAPLDAPEADASNAPNDAQVALYTWTLLWSAVEIAVVLAIAAARIPRLSVTPGRAVLIILALCLINERAGGTLVNVPAPWTRPPARRMSPGTDDGDPGGGAGARPGRTGKQSLPWSVAPATSLGNGSRKRQRKRVRVVPCARSIDHGRAGPDSGDSPWIPPWRCSYPPRSPR